MKACPKCGYSDNSPCRSECYFCGFEFPDGSKPQPPTPARESYAEAQAEFLRLRMPHHLASALFVLEKWTPLDALLLATELQRLCQLRANEAQLAKEERLA